MRNFDATMWSPRGSRPHILALPAAPIRGLAAAYVDTIRAWWADQD